MLRASSVSRSFTGVQALDGVTLELDRREVVGLIGPNGAGKSTLLKAVLGLVKVRSGHVRLKGEDITGRRAHELVERGVAFVPQTRNVFPSLTVRENLEMGCFLRPSMFESSFHYVTELFPRLRERAGQRAGALSGGERQMVAMGRALMSKPKLLMLDEPSMGLSPIMMQRIMTTVSELREQGVTILLVEQNAQAALSLADRGYVIETGRVVLEDNGRALLGNEQVRKAYLGED